MSFHISYNVSGSGPAIIFIHGIGSRAITWDGVIKKLINRYKCVTYDLRGHGKSIFGNSIFDLDDLVNDLEDLRSYLNIDKFHIVGHSLGGMIGPSYVRKYPKRVYSLSLLSTAAYRQNEDKQKIINIIQSIKDQGIYEVLPKLINRWFTDGFIAQNKDIIKNRMNQVYETDLATFLNVFNIYAITEMSSWLHEINLPSLIMTGENDEGCSPKLNKKIAGAVSKSQLVILKNLKHTITLESPELVGIKIREFLERIK